MITNPEALIPIHRLQGIAPAIYELEAWGLATIFEARNKNNEESYLVDEATFLEWVFTYNQGIGCLPISDHLIKKRNLKSKDDPRCYSLDTKRLSQIYGSDNKIEINKENLILALNNKQITPALKAIFIAQPKIAFFLFENEIFIKKLRLEDRHFFVKFLLEQKLLINLTHEDKFSLLRFYPGSIFLGIFKDDFRDLKFIKQLIQDQEFLRNLAYPLSKKIQEFLLKKVEHWHNYKIEKSHVINAELQAEDNRLTPNLLNFSYEKIKVQNLKMDIDGLEKECEDLIRQKSILSEDLKIKLKTPKQAPIRSSKTEASETAIPAEELNPREPGDLSDVSAGSAEVGRLQNRIEMTSREITSTEEKLRRVKTNLATSEEKLNQQSQFLSVNYKNLNRNQELLNSQASIDRKEAEKCEEILGALKYYPLNDEKNVKRMLADENKLKEFKAEQDRIIKKMGEKKTSYMNNRNDQIGPLDYIYQQHASDYAIALQLSVAGCDSNMLDIQQHPNKQIKKWLPKSNLQKLRQRKKNSMLVRSYIGLSNIGKDSVYCPDTLEQFQINLTAAVRSKTVPLLSNEDVNKILGKLESNVSLTFEFIKYLIQGQSVTFTSILQGNIENNKNSHLLKTIKAMLDNPELNKIILEMSAHFNFTAEQLVILAELDKTNTISKALVNTSYLKRFVSIFGFKDASNILATASGKTLARLVIKDPSISNIILENHDSIWDTGHNYFKQIQADQEAIEMLLLHNNEDLNNKIFNNPILKSTFNKNINSFIKSIEITTDFQQFYNDEIHKRLKKANALLNSSLLNSTQELIIKDRISKWLGKVPENYYRVFLDSNEVLSKILIDYIQSNDLEKRKIFTSIFSKFSFEAKNEFIVECISVGIVDIFGLIEKGMIKFDDISGENVISLFFATTDNNKGKLIAGLANYKNLGGILSNHAFYSAILAHKEEIETFYSQNPDRKEDLNTVCNKSKKLFEMVENKQVQSSHQLLKTIRTKLDQLSQEKEMPPIILAPTPTRLQSPRFLEEAEQSRSPISDRVVASFFPQGKKLTPPPSVKVPSRPATPSYKILA